MLGLFGLFRKQPQPPARKMTAAAIYASAQSGAGMMVTPDRAMRVSTVYACVRIIAESIAQLPCKIYRRKPDGSQETLDSGPLFDLLHFPNPWQNSFEFREYMMTCLCLRGNFFALKVQRRGEVLELLPLRPDSVKVERRNWKLFYTYTDADGNTGTVGEDKMLHVRGLSLDGIMGVSPIRYGRDAIGLAMATEGHGARMFKNGARPGGVLKHPGKLSDEALEHLKLSWQASHGGENTGGTAILEEGMSYENISMTNEDAQYLDTRQFQRTEICALFRVPPHMIGDLTKSSFSNIEQQALEFVKYSVLPWCKRIETALWHSLLSDKQRQEGYRIEFLVDGLERADIKTRYESYSIAIQNGILSPNECRRLENRNPREGGDVFLQPLNMTDSSQGKGDEEEAKALPFLPPWLQARLDKEQGEAGKTVVMLSEAKHLLKNTGMVAEASPASITETDRRCFTSLREVQHDSASEEFFDPQITLFQRNQEKRDREIGCTCKAADEEEDDEPEHDDWADGEWSEEVAEQNAIMLRFRGKLQKLFEPLIREECTRVRALVERFFPAEKSLKATPDPDFMRALEGVYEKLGKAFAGNSVKLMYHEFAAAVAAAAARKVGIPMGDLDKALKESVGRYVDIVAEDHVKSSIDQIRNIITKAGSSTFDAKAELEKLLGRWGENGAKKLSMLQAVATANHYARNTYRQLGVKNIRWVAQGGKTCQFCRKMNGRTTQIEAPFLPGGKEFTEGFTPRRKVKYPPLHRGCVCAIVPFFDKLAGVERGKPCTANEALERCNPGIKTGESGYNNNCVICAGAFEAQLQGYDVIALSSDKNIITKLIGHEDSLTNIWEPPEGLDKIPIRRIKCDNSSEMLKILKEQINEGERYIFSYINRARDGRSHVVNILKESGLLKLYDSQHRRKYVETADGRIESMDNLEKVYDKLSQIVYHSSWLHELFRVDNLQFSEKYTEKIFQGR